MNGSLKKDIVRNLLIVLSYYVFWSIVVIVSRGRENTKVLTSLLDYLWQILYLGTINLLIFVKLVPYIKAKRIKWIWIVIFFIPVLAMIVFGFYGWNLLGGFLGLISSWANREREGSFLIPATIQVVFGLIYHATIYFVLMSMRLEIQNRQLLLEKKQSELSFLKSQTNPHFLFNTMNNLYSLARIKSDLTAESILKLSDILRYMLYGAEIPSVAIEQEVKIIQEYIELEKLRYDSTLMIELITEIDDWSAKVPPLMMIHLVENAFKHGVSETINNPFITIHLQLEKTLLSLTVTNSINPALRSARNKENIGLTNLRRQLGLLFSDYKLAISENPDSFQVRLMINLDRHA